MEYRDDASERIDLTLVAGQRALRCSAINNPQSKKEVIMSRFVRIAAPFALAAALAAPVLAAPPSSGASTPKASAVKLLTCADTTVSRPSSFVISCADANSALSATHWSTWSANSATGSTRFALNLCQPSCAASKMSYFPNSVVRLSAPVSTKHGRLFSRLQVRYLLRGKLTSFSFSWTGDSNF
jgi:hypothetical protein